MAHRLGEHLVLGCDLLEAGNLVLGRRRVDGQPPAAGRPCRISPRCSHAGGPAAPRAAPARLALWGAQGPGSIVDSLPLPLCCTTVGARRLQEHRRSTRAHLASCTRQHAQNPWRGTAECHSLYFRHLVI